MKNPLSIILISLLLWAGCFYLGTDLSRRRPLGGYELHTHINTVEPLAYKDIVSGKGLEGNNGPLFYVIQKAVTQRLGRIDQEKDNGGQLVHDERSQVLLRRASDAFMSGAVALTFFAVAWFYSVSFALLATAVFLSFPGTWLYWVIAQPYSLWIFLTVLQSVFFLRTVHGRADPSIRTTAMAVGFTQDSAPRAERTGATDKPVVLHKSRAWAGLLPVNILLSLTNIFGVLQVCVTSLVVWAVNKKHWVHAIGLAMVPLVIGAYYLQYSAGIKYLLNDGSMSDKVPLEYWVLIPIIVGIRYAHQRLRDDPWLRLDLWLLVCGFLLLRAVHTYIDILNSGTFWRLI